MRCPLVPIFFGITSFIVLFLQPILIESDAADTSRQGQEQQLQKRRFQAGCVSGEKTKLKARSPKGIDRLDGMEVTFKYFAWVRERIGHAEEKATLPDHVETVGDVMKWLKARGEGYASAFEREEIVRAAIDHTHAKHSAPVKGAREIAFFPPVTGG